MLSVDVARRLASIDVRAGLTLGEGVTVIFGRSGAGKTSLVHMIAGILRPDSGRIVLDGVPLFDAARGIDVPVHQRRIGYVYQDARLFPHLTVRQNLLFGTWFTRKADRRLDLGRVAGMLGLEALLGRRPRDLSGGEKQRVAIGRALLQSPRLLVMDEPLASLDRPRRREILGFLETLRHETGVPVIYVTHSVRELMRLADVVVVMAEGGVVASGPVADVLSRHDLRALTGHAEAGSIVDAVVSEHDDRYGLSVLEFAGGRLVVPGTRLAIGSAARVRIRARDVSVAVVEPRGVSVQNVLRGTIARMHVPAGPVLELTADVAGTELRARVTRRAADQLGLAPGQSVFLLVKALSIDRRNVAETRR
jgi:molybdate transport system ATP-binding protein